MLKLISKPTEILWPVTVRERDEVTGQIVETEIKIRYRFEADWRKTKKDDSVVGWENIADADGNPLPFSPENRDLVLGHLAANHAIERGWLELIQGAHLRKN